jgi:hypothetical protein
LLTSRAGILWVLTFKGRIAMSDSSDTNDASGGPEELERVPAMQRLLDNPFLLLFIGVTIPTVLYLIWGIMEVAQIPMAR